MRLFLSFSYAALFIFHSIDYCQLNDSIKMNTSFYIDDLENPAAFEINSVEIKPADSELSLRQYIPEPGDEGYCFRFINPERNSRLNSHLPHTDLWEVKWSSPIKTNDVPWYLLIRNDRILLHSEASWHLFNINGIKTAEGVKDRGDIAISRSEEVFYVNDHSGFLQAIDLLTGKRKFYVYPFLGKGFERSVIFTNGTKIIYKAFELPVMTHNSPLTNPSLNILEILNLGTSRETDTDGILKSSPSAENLMLKAGKIISAVHSTTIIAAVTNSIYIIDDKLHVNKELTGNFIPLEMSLDEEMRIYLLVSVQTENEWSTEYWLLDTDGNLYARTKIPLIHNNYIAPPAIDHFHNAYIMNDQKITAVQPSGNILWEEYIQKPLGGVTAGKDYLLVCEGGLLTSFNHKGIRKFIYNFNQDLAAPALLYNNELFVVTKTNLFCLRPKK